MMKEEQQQQQEGGYPSGDLLLMVRDFIYRHYVVGWMIILGTIVLWWCRLRRRKMKRVVELDNMIAKVRFERDAMLFMTLSKVSNVSNKKNTKSLSSSSVTIKNVSNDDDVDGVNTIMGRSATGTVKRIHSKSLDLLENIVNRSHHCREYGRSDEYNAITEELYDEAYEKGQRLTQLPDEMKRKQLLHGVPISIKDCIAMRGHYCTGGLACRLRQKSQHDSLIVRLLEDAGAIPLCRGNTIQLMLGFESVNRIWGRTKNPLDTSRTPGGSSGGDAALVALGCVPLSVGTDLGGSIRIPAAFCGIVGFKPTSTRISTMGNLIVRKNDRNGTMIALPSSVGPMAKTVDDCALFMKAVCVPAMWKTDPSVPPLPFDESEYNSTRKLTIGYLRDDKDWFEPCDAVKRGIDETIQHLTELGHTCIPFQPPTDSKFHQQLMTKLQSADGNFRSIEEALEGEPLIDEFHIYRIGCRVPDIVRWFLCTFILDERKATIYRQTKKNGFNVYEYWDILADLISVRKQWSAAFVSQQMDALILPTYPLVSPKHCQTTKLMSSFGRSYIANHLLWPSGTIPVTTVQEHEQQYYDVTQLPKFQQDNISTLVHDEVMKNSVGLPISVSVMTPQYHDELCLRIMKQIEQKVQQKPK